MRVEDRAERMEYPDIAMMLLRAFAFFTLFSLSTAFVVKSSPRYAASCLQHQTVASEDSSKLRCRPLLIVLDLDGNLWRPEMYELAWDGYGHAPFERIDDTRMKSKLNRVVTLIGDVAELLDEFVLSTLLNDQSDTTSTVEHQQRLAISSRTDVPKWAIELLGKFTLPKSRMTLKEAITGPWEISSDSKTVHFQRLAKATGIALQDMVFFDNELGNCRSIAKLGVTVGYCPDGIKRAIWINTMAAFPNTDGSIIGEL